MPSLNDLHRKLYSHNNKDLINREKSPDNYGKDAEKNFEKEKSLKKVGSSSQQSKKDEQQTYFQEDLINNQPIEINSMKIETIISRLNKNKLKISGIILAVIFLIVGSVVGYIKYKQMAFNQENIVIEFQGNQEVKSGEEFEYKLLIHNNNRVVLKNTQIKIEYPEELTPVIMNYTKQNTSNSLLIDTGDIKAQETRDFQLKFSAFSPRENQVYLNTDFRYEPSNFSSIFNKKSNCSIDVKGSVIDFSLISQQEVSNGEVLKLVAALNNNTVINFDDLVLEINVPEDFSLLKTGLDSVEGFENKFKIPELKANSKLEIEILGSFNSEINSVKNLQGVIGSMDNNKGDFSEISLAEESVRVIPSRIEIFQEIVNGVNTETQTTYMGSDLGYRINFKNNSANPLLDLILKEELNSDLIDVSSIHSESGYYDQDKQEIIWRASDVPVLKTLNPGESGFVEFKFKLKENLDLNTDKTNQTLITQAKISSLNIETALLSNKEISSGPKKIKINTKLDILVSGQFEGGVFSNTGPLPLKSGEETTFTVKVALKNNFNKINNPNLTIKLPSGIIWKNSFHRSSGEVTFNERANELKWKLNYLNAQIGYKYPEEELIFQIGVVPQINQVNKNFPLINSINLKGFETFIEKNIERNLKRFNLNVIKDYDF